MMIAIVLSAIVIFLLSFPSLEHTDWLLLLDNLFLVFFLIEAIVKIRELGFKSYIKDGWNRFDFFLVIVSLPAFLVWLEELGFAFHVPEIFTNIIVLRLFRLLRIFRALDFIPHMSKMMSGVVRALKASTLVILVLFIFNVILAIFSCHLFGPYAPEHFDNPLNAAYTVFQMFTVEGWYEIPALIEENSDSAGMAVLARIYFVLVVLLGGVFGMSLANAIFVDEMTADNNEELEVKIDELHAEIRELKNLLKK